MEWRFGGEVGFERGRGDGGKGAIGIGLDLYGEVGVEHGDSTLDAGRDGKGKKHT